MLEKFWDFLEKQKEIDAKLQILKNTVSKKGVEAPDSDGRTLLMFAAYEADKLACTFLLNKGANLNAQNNFGETPLHHAVCARNGLETADFLLQKGANVNAQTKAGYTPLILAVVEGNREVASRLMEHGADTSMRAVDGKTALMYAVESRRLDKSQTVLDLIENKADVNAADDNGKTVLMYAALDGKEEIVTELLSHGASADAKNQNGETVSDLVKKAGNKKMLKLLTSNASLKKAGVKKIASQQKKRPEKQHVR